MKTAQSTVLQTQEPSSQSPTIIQFFHTACFHKCLAWPKMTTETIKKINKWTHLVFSRSFPCSLLKDSSFFIGGWVIIHKSVTHLGLFFTHDEGVRFTDASVEYGQLDNMLIILRTCFLAYRNVRGRKEQENIWMILSHIILFTIYEQYRNFVLLFQ